MKDIKKLDSREVYMYLGIEGSHDIEHKNEKKAKEGIFLVIEISFGYRFK